MALNFINSLKNTKTRTLVLVVGSTLVAGVIFLITNLKGGEDPAKQNPSKVVGVPREAQSVPGTQTSEQYRKLLEEENKKRAEEAERDKKSAIPTFKGAGVTDPNNPFGSAAGANPQFGMGGAAGRGNNDPFGDTSRGGFVGGGTFNAKDQQRMLEEDRQKRLEEQKKRLAAIEEDKRRKADMEQRRKELEAAEKQYIQSVQETTTQMANYAKGATLNWTTVQPQSYVRGIYSDDKKENVKSDGSDENSVNNNASSSGTSTRDGRVNALSSAQKAAQNQELIKAGTVLYAVLDTSINSDEAGPVLATVVSGKYKGARLLGKVQLPNNAKKVIITFTTMSLPKRKESVAIDAYAIDPETARTAFASEVDNHYLLRYGSLFASSFMEGFGKAVGQQGTTTTDPSGSQIQTKPELSATDQIYTAFGTVGEKWSKQVEPLFKTPVTVTVNQGLGVGILIMRDADVSPRSGESSIGASVNTVTQTTTTTPISSANVPAVISNISNSAATPN